MHIYNRRWGASVQLMFPHTLASKVLEDRVKGKTENGGGGGRPKERVVKGHMISSSCYPNRHMGKVIYTRKNFSLFFFFFLKLEGEVVLQHEKHSLKPCRHCYLIDPSVDCNSKRGKMKRKNPNFNGLLKVSQVAISGFRCDLIS